MNKNILFFLCGILTCFSNINAQTPGYNWYKQAGGQYRELGSALSVDQSGNVYVTGEYRGNISFGNNISLQSSGASGDIDYYLVKLNSMGDAVWAKKGGGSSADRGLSVVTNGEYVYTAGAYSKTAVFDDTTLVGTENQLDAFLAKYDSSGKLIWIREGKSASQVSVKSVALDNSDNIIICGYFGSASYPTATFEQHTITSAGERDLYLAKYNQDGNLLWIKTAGGVNPGEEGEAVSVDQSGNIYVGGFMADSAYFENVFFNAVKEDAFLAKYDSNGNLQWVRTASGIGNDRIKSIATDDEGDIYTTGYFDSSAVFGSTKLVCNDGLDIFIAKYDSNGDLLWVKAAGSSKSDYGYGIAANSTGCFLTGKFAGTITFGLLDIASINGGDDVYISKYDPDGNFIWVKQFGGVESESGNAIKLDLGGNIYVTGNFKSTITLDNENTLTSTGVEDIFVIKLGNAPVPVELSSFDYSVWNGSIRLAWSSVTETNNAFYEIERSSDYINFRKIGSVKGNGTTSERHNYEFIDQNVKAGEYYYRLKQIDYNGTFTYSHILKVKFDSPSQFNLQQNYPNPFNPETVIKFELPIDANVSVTVYDMIGREVASPVSNKYYSSGIYDITFNSGSLSSGIYLYALKVDCLNGQQFSSTKKMTIMK